MLLTSVSDFISGIELAENESVEQAVQIERTAQREKIRFPVLQELDWERLYQSANPEGALPPKLAQSLTQIANRRRWARQKALRSGNKALIRAIA